MTVAALPGNVELRAFQLGLQSSFGTAIPATRRVPWTFTPTVDPHWTVAAVDTGTLDPGLPPYRTGIDVTGQTSGPLTFDDVINLYAGLIVGGQTGSGGGANKAWTFTGASTTADAYDLFTAEWGDEVAGDQFQYADGIVDKLVLSWPQDLGPVTHQADWRFSSVVYPHALTAALAVDLAPAYIYAADTRLYIDSYAGAIGTSPLVNSMHDATVTISGNTDVKRFANGSNARFNAAGYSRGKRMVETAFTLAKSTAGLVEFANFLNAAPTERFVCLDTSSAQLITGAIPYTHKLYFAGYWYTRTEQAVNGNSAASLVCRQVYDPALAYGLKATVANKRATLA